MATPKVIVRYCVGQNQKKGNDLKTASCDRDKSYTPCFKQSLLQEGQRGGPRRGLTTRLKQVLRFRTRILGLLPLVFYLATTQTAVADTLIYGGSILTMAEDQSAPFEGYIHIKDSKIIAIGPMSEMPSNVQRKIDASGKVVMPGFISGHNHLWQSALRSGKLSRPFTANAVARQVEVP